MKTARTYVFMFVPIPRHWWQGSGTVGSAGILPALSGMLPDNAQHGTSCDVGKKSVIVSAAQEVVGNMPATAGNMPALPDQLFWTWFVDNPRPHSRLLWRR
jgi:hypothetical protein